MRMSVHQVFPFLATFLTAVPIVDASFAAGIVAPVPLAVAPEPLDEQRKRAVEYAKEGKYKEAIAGMERYVVRAPSAFDILGVLAWIYATCPEAKYRDGKKALQYARHADHLWLTAAAEDKRAYYTVWVAIAAAHAELGEFDKAIAAQKKAMEYVKEFAPEEYREMAAVRVAAVMELYKAKKPLRSKKIALGWHSDDWVKKVEEGRFKGFPEVAD